MALSTASTLEAINASFGARELRGVDPTADSFC